MGLWTTALELEGEHQSQRGPEAQVTIQSKVTMPYIEYLDYTRKEITPGMALKLRESWVMRFKNTLTEEQQAFLDKIAKIHYAEEDAFCFCRYTNSKTIAMRYSNLYVMKCERCGKSYTTDEQPKTVDKH